MVDELKQDWHVIAPDWRGYGETEWLSRPYWFPDYYADLMPRSIIFSRKGTRSLTAWAPILPATTQGYAPERISQLVMLDFLGLKPPAEDTSPLVIERWLDNINKGPAPIVYRDHEAFANRLMALNPGLTETTR